MCATILFWCGSREQGHYTTVEVRAVDAAKQDRKWDDINFMYRNVARCRSHVKNNCTKYLWGRSNNL